jgi:hypothetical protein
VSPQLVKLFDQLAEQLGDARDFVITGTGNEIDADPEDVLRGLYWIRTALCTVAEIRDLVGNDGGPSDLRGMVAATQGRPVDS